MEKGREIKHSFKTWPETNRVRRSYKIDAEKFHSVPCPIQPAKPYVITVMMHYGLCYTNDEGTKNFSERALLVGENSAASIMSKCDRTIWNIYGNFLANIKFYEQLFPCTLTLSLFLGGLPPFLAHFCRRAAARNRRRWMHDFFSLWCCSFISNSHSVKRIFFFAGNVIWLNVWFLLKMKYYFLLLTHPPARLSLWNRFRNEQWFSIWGSNSSN